METMPAEDRGPGLASGKWRQVAIRLAKWTFVLLLVVLSVAITWSGYYYQAQPLLSSALLSIGTSIIASIVFAVLYSWVVERLLVEHVKEQIDERLQQHESRVKALLADDASRMAATIDGVIAERDRSSFQIISRALSSFVPLRIYPSTIESSKDFVRNVVDNLRKTSEYTFRGVTARHVAAFLSLARPSHIACKVMILDPRNQEMIALYVKDRFDVNAGGRAELESKIRAVREEILTSVVALFDVSRFVPVHLKLHQGPVFMRSEVFDQEAFLSVYAGFGSTPFPGTYVFAKETLFFTFIRKDSQECSSLRTPEVTFSATSDESDLVRFLAGLSSEPYSIDELRRRGQQTKEEVLTAVGE